MMTALPFAQLNQGRYRPEDCISSRHFWEQAVKRNFTRADLATVLREGIWHPDAVQVDCWNIQAGRWAIAVRIDEETPILITPKLRAEFTRVVA